MTFLWVTIFLASVALIIRNQEEIDYVPIQVPTIGSVVFPPVKYVGDEPLAPIVPLGATYVFMAQTGDNVYHAS